MMSAAEEATINPDGSTTFNDASASSTGGDFGGSAGNDTPENNMGSGSTGDGDGDAVPDGSGEEPTVDDMVKGIDPALYLAVIVTLFAILFIYLQLRKKRNNASVDDFFSNLDGDKFNLKLPAAVDEYYEVKSKCEEEGWEPGQAPEGGQPNAHHRQLAQALMKRCIADIPIVTHIQRESAGMNKLYSQSMCSVKQWKSFQACEAMVSAEVEEVRAEADEIEPGWSNVVWRQAMQYHNMLKQKEEQAKVQAADQVRAIAEKKKAEDDKKAAEQARYDEIKKRVEDEKARIANAEKVAAELLKQEEREKDSKKAFSGKGGSGIKKGFLG